MSKLIVRSLCSKWYSKPAISHGGCNGHHASTAVSWTSCRTPPRGKSMSYTVVVPYAEDVDLGLMCHQLNKKYPKKSCVLAVDRLVHGKRVRPGACILPAWFAPCFAHAQHRD